MRILGLEEKDVKPNSMNLGLEEMMLKIVSKIYTNISRYTSKEG